MNELKKYLQVQLKKIFHTFRLYQYKHFPNRYFGIKSITICDEIKDAKHVLVCLPENEKLSGEFLKSLNRFYDIFPEAKITISHNSSMNVNFNGFTYFEFNHDQLTLWGGLDKPLEDRIFEPKIQVAIDLNRSFNPDDTLLICASHANLRIGFSHPKRDSYYNFVIRMKQNQDLETCFDTMLKFLSAGE